MLILENTALIIVDVQDKLFHVMHEKGALLENLQKMIKGAQILGIPILLTEQNPEKLGATMPEVARLLPRIQPIHKLSFSCSGNKHFMQELRTLKRKQILIAGIETHVCVYQTSMDLASLGYEVQVIADAVSSRTAENKEIGLERIKSGRTSLTSTEMALFELLKAAEGREFKEILKIVK